MSEPTFLPVEAVMIFHETSLEQYGGISGVRDEDGLLSAISQPQNTYYYGQGDLYDVAAAYAFHIGQAQAFLDGNKRTAVLAALSFLELNQVPRHVDDVGLYDAMIAIAERRCDKPRLAALLRGGPKI